MSSHSKLEEEIGHLADLPRAVLVERWVKLYRCPPPKSIKRGLLERALAWHLQAKHLGGLSPSVKRQLKAATQSIASGTPARLSPADGANALIGSANSPDTASATSSTSGSIDTVLATPTPSATPTNSASLTPGTRLIREWHGKSHSVDVIEEGFVFEGRTYGSLSAIAREITGARWSGPRFFGI